MKMKISLILFLTTFYSYTINAQIFKTQYEIIKEEGSDYNRGVAENGFEFISYYKSMNSEVSGEFTQAKAFYFYKREDGIKICNRYKIIEPASETNSNVTMMKKSGLVEIDYMQWKDYENEVLYIISVKDGYCTFDAMWNRDL